jgi:hypothetical protein
MPGKYFYWGNIQLNSDPENKQDPCKDAEKNCPALGHFECGQVGQPRTNRETPSVVGAPRFSRWLALSGRSWKAGYQPSFELHVLDARPNLRVV